MFRVGGSARRRIGAAVVLWAALSLVACGGGGSSGGGETLGPGSGSGGASTTSTVTLGWGEAAGPVAGYRVWVQRGTDSPQVETDVEESRATLTGEPGSQARIMVAAFDALGRVGPASAPSPWFTFPDPSAASAGQGDGGSGSGSPDPSDPIAGGGPGGDPTPGSDGSPDPGDGAAPGDEADEADDADAPTVSLAGGILWESGDALRVTNADLETLALLARPWSGAQLAAVADLDADGRADLLWSDADGGLAYQPGADLASGTPAAVDFAQLEVDERVIGAGDLDGDGIDDLLVQRGGTVDAWYTLPGGGIETLELGSAGAAVLEGVGDFDANGVDDAVFSRDATVAIWLMDANGVSAIVEMALSPDRAILAIGDLDGDGAAEIALRDAAGDVLLGRPLEPVLEGTDLTGTLPWQSAGATDVDGDGSEDLVLFTADALRIGTLPGDTVLSLGSVPWTIAALLP